MVSMGSGKPARNWGGPIWGLGGMILGSVLTWAGPKAMHRFRGNEEKTSTKSVKAAPTLSPTRTLELTVLQQKGILLKSNSPVKLLQPSESKRTEQQGNAVFTGFKNWNATATYLKTAQGGIFVADSSKKQVQTGWKEADFDKFVRGLPLHVELWPGQAYTLFFQREHQRPINLGTISVGVANSKPAAKPTAKPAAPAAVGAAKTNPPVHVVPAGQAGKAAKP